VNKSPLAPDQYPELPALQGVRLSTIATGVKYVGRDDLMLAAFDPGTTVAGVFTRSSTASAPVVLCRKNLNSGIARGLIVNAGNANAFTGDTGHRHASEMADAVAHQLDCDAQQVFVASTGVIGEFLPLEKIVDAIEPVASKLNAANWQQASEAIMTTDTFAKGATANVLLGNDTVTINGFAKGSGMIEPNMATMLAFLITDAAIAPALLQQMLGAVNQESFNSITVDSDTSTSDTCLLFATGKSMETEITDLQDPRTIKFLQTLRNVMINLARQVVCDGEGASKLIEINVSGATSAGSARIVAKAVANSPLVKTAIAGEDANWGRVVMAVGKSGEPCDQHKLKIGFGGVAITQHGKPREDYDESRVAEHLKQQSIKIDIDLGLGAWSATVWTCDLTHDYISINADYRS